jgi:hypothetical protein
MNYEGSRSVICNPVKSEITNYFDKNVANGQKPRKRSGRGHIPLDHGHITKNGKIKIFHFFQL